MTTRWKEKVSLALTIITVICAFLLVILLWSAVSNGMLSSSSSLSSSTSSPSTISSSSSKSKSNSNKFNISNEINLLPNNNNVENNVADVHTTLVKNLTPNFDRKLQGIVNKTSSVENPAKSNEYTREEYVKPSKIHLPLHTIDLLYESKKNNTFDDLDSQGHRITGNYRNRSSRIWDPHPEYEFNAFGQHLHLILHQDAAFIPPTIKVTHVWANRTVSEDDEDHKHLQGCFYKGHVRGDDKSTVTVSLCNGMRGHIWTTFGSYFIEPVEEYTNQDLDILHKIRRESKLHKDNFFNMPKEKNCPIEEHLKGNNRDDINISIIDDDNDFERHQRRKRNTHNDHSFTLEVLIAVDLKMQQFHGNREIKSYILTLMSIVSNIYSDASIGNSINIAVVNIMLLQEHLNVDYIKQGVYASELLKHFCSFMQTRRDIHYDTAILLTREQICRNTTQTKCDTLGLAELGTVCSKHSCSIVQDNGLPAAFTIAHELGHILYMPHDDDSKCDKFHKHGKKMLNIMSSAMGDEIHPWSWSDCSRHYVTEFLEKPNVACMNNKPDYQMKKFNKQLPGEIYNLNQQCELIHGANARYCNISVDNEKECNRLWCFEKYNTEDCRTSNLPWADGTPCSGPNHWCQKGSCVQRDLGSLKPIHGGWGGWSAYSQCSRTCGGGIQESTRECNNPTPANGGKYCIGKPKEYRSCNTQDCSSDILDFREQQCTAKNGNNYDIQGIDKNVKWVPKYGVSSKDECKLYCRVEQSTLYFQLEEKVIDGTTCSFDNFKKCVNGVCRNAGCDNKLNSDAQLDSCGVCQGRNDTCEEITRNVYRSDIKGQEFSRSPFYFYITKIPAGAANIRITQPGFPVENYIVLLDDRGEYLLNGNNVINTYKINFPYAGVSFDYNGSDNKIEEINTTRSRKIKRDLIVEILSLPVESRTEDAILLTYSYTIGKKPKRPDVHIVYDWQLEEWTPCDSICGGTSYRTPVCLDIIMGHKVAESYCDQRNKLQKKYTNCNTDCELFLNTTSVSECSSNTCGVKGIRTKNLHCIQKYLKNEHSKIVDISHCESKYPIEKYEECTGSCVVWGFTSWSQCTQTCRKGRQYGRQTRSLVCISQLNGAIVDNSKCSHLPKLSNSEAVIQLCNTDPCPEWSYGEETPCSVTCGLGHRTTAIFCNRNNQIVDRHLCAGLPMLNSIRINCTMPPCDQRFVMPVDRSSYPIKPTTSSLSSSSYPHNDFYTSNYNAWAFTEWGECNQYCQRTRTVYCNDSNQNNCSEHLKPSEKSKCCDIKYVPYWSNCSVKCGQGKRNREFRCARVYKSPIKGVKPRKEFIDINYCQHLKKPTPKRSTKSCKMVCKWTLGKWSPCSCNEKVSTAELTCSNNQGLVVPNEYCKARKKPIYKKRCIKCKKKTIQYSNCTCDGYKRNRMICFNVDNPNEKCSDEHNRESCTPPAGCLARSCLQHSKKNRHDGDYMISIKGKTVKIYCHNMMKSNPTEYISLSNNSENYAHFYPRRTHLIHKCPPESQHEEYSDDSMEYGSTIFSKIRLELNTLKIIDDDYTFATHNGKPQPYGSAGDCYNADGKCPQGYFSIDLNNTGFRIRHTNWDTHGTNSTIEFTEKLSYPYTKVKASCGGYCGNCRISQHTNLRLDVV